MKGSRPHVAHVAVIGAGAFGGWTALSLLEKGARVTLLDAWGAGHPRSSSGDESRILRGLYGPDRVYTEWVARAFPVWRESGRRFGVPLFVPLGALWMFTGDDSYARSAIPHLSACGLAIEEIEIAEAARRWPAIRFDGLGTVFVEEGAGYVKARQACRAVARAVAGWGGGGGQVLEKAVRPGAITGGTMRGLALSDGGTLEADAYVFACGPWLPEVFPEVVGPRIQPTRQEVYYFSTPAGDPHFAPGALPVWVEFDSKIFYGIPTEGHGFKIADDTRGEPLDPTTAVRTITPSFLAEARARMARRFPALKDAPLVESRVCQYENSPDGNLILDRHPEAANAWIVGGGSGHGFKLGPTVGEEAASAVLGGEVPAHLAAFGLSRLSGDSVPLRTQFDS